MKIDFNVILLIATLTFMIITGVFLLKSIKTNYSMLFVFFGGLSLLAFYLAQGLLPPKKV